jgi:hypothetical protein
LSEVVPNPEQLSWFLIRGFVIPYFLLEYWQSYSIVPVQLVTNHLSQIDFSVPQDRYSVNILRTLVDAGWPVPHYLSSHAIAVDDAQLLIYLLSQGYCLSLADLEKILAYSSTNCIRALHAAGRVFPTYLLQKVYSDQGSNPALSYLMDAGYRLIPEMIMVT